MVRALVESQVRLQHRPFRNHTRLDEPPQRNQEISRERDDSDLADALAPRTEAAFEPPAEVAFGLEA